MSWNYRLVEFDDIDEGKYFEIKEVYYDEGGNLLGYCDATVGSNNLAGIIEQLDAMRAAAHRSVLKKEEFFKGKNNDSAE